MEIPTIVCNLLRRMRYYRHTLGINRVRPASHCVNCKLSRRQHLRNTKCLTRDMCASPTCQAALTSLLLRVGPHLQFRQLSKPAVVSAAATQRLLKALHLLLRNLPQHRG